MRIHRQPALPLDGCALTIGNFDGVHRGHQAMLARLREEARRRGLPTCVLTFEPHPRDHFARRAAAAGAADAARGAPTRISTLRDKLSALAQQGIDHVVVARFDDALASQSPAAFVGDVLVRGLHARWVLVGDDFRYGARRAGTHESLAAAGAAAGFEVARLDSHAVDGVRVSSSALRHALAAGDLAGAQRLMGRPYTISGRVQHGRKLGRELGFRTLNIAFGHPRPAASGIFVVRVHGLTPAPVDGVASLGTRPSVEDSGRVLLETHVLEWPAQLPTDAGYGRCLTVELRHRLHEELRYDSLEALRQGIAADVAAARSWCRHAAADLGAG